MLAPAAQNVLQALPSATTKECEERFDVARAFEEHLREGRSLPTAILYRGSFRRLFTLHKKTFAAMASDAYVGVVRQMARPIDAASMRAFGVFWSKRQAGALEPRPVGSELASAEDREHFPIVMKSFERHLEKEYQPRTSALYGKAFKKLFNTDGQSLDAMASAGYLDTLRNQHKPAIPRASAAAFKTFVAKRGRAFLKSAVKSEGRGRLSSKGGEEEASDISQGLQPFLDHLHVKKNPQTAIQYGQALRKLTLLHRKSLDAMASVEYLAFVRKKNLPGKYPAAVKAFYEFRSAERLEQPELETPEKRKRKFSNEDGKKDEAPEARKRKFSNDDGKKDECDMTGVVAKKGCAFVKLAVKSKGHGRVSSKGGGEEASNISQGLQPFMDHLHVKKNRQTAIQYGQALRKLMLLHRKSLDAMASVEYLAFVRKKDLPGKYPAAVKAFYEFRSAERLEQPELETPEARKRKFSNEDGKKDEGDLTGVDAAKRREDASDIVDGLQPFIDHLYVKMAPPCAAQYAQAIRKLLHEHRKSLDVMASQAYLDLVRRMNWPNKYSAVVRALCKFRSGVALGHGEQLDRAKAEAQKRLAAAQASSRPISDADVLAVLRLWPFAQNTARKNVMPKGTEWVHSSTVGIIGDYQGRSVIARNTRGSEDLVTLLCKWLEHQLGVGFGAEAFPMTSININKGYAATRHRDRNNMGPSAIRSLGDCRGGLLQYWPTAAPDAHVDGLRDEDAVLLDPRHSVALFDGNFPHAVTPFEGERYSLVFFTSRLYKKATEKSQTEAVRLGMRWPTPQLIAASQARVANP